MKLIFSKALSTHLFSVAEKYRDAQYTLDAQKAGARCIQQFCEENGGLLANGGGYGLASYSKEIKSCKRFPLAKLTERPCEFVGRKLENGWPEFDHPLYLKRGRTPIAVVSSPYSQDRSSAPTELDGGLTIVKAPAPSWYAPGHCDLLFVLGPTTKLEIEA